jgi:hypothetical protein
MSGRSAAVWYPASSSARSRAIRRAALRTCLGLVVPVGLLISVALYLFAPTLAGRIFEKAYLAVPFSTPRTARLAFTPSP